MENNTTGPFIKDKNSTSKMMCHLMLALLPIILFTVYKNGYIPYQKGTGSFLSIFYPLFFILIPTFVSVITETIWLFLVKKKRGDDLKTSIFSSYAMFPGLFLGLILPLNTPLSIVILGSVVATILGKMIYGGFGNNIFNPALIGYLFIMATYALTITNHGGYFNSYEVNTIASSTPLSNASVVNGIGTYETLVAPYGSLWNFLIGTIPGSMGETSALLCILAFIYLTLTKVIKWKIPVTYISTVFFLTFLIGSINGQGIWYPLFMTLSGGLLFGAVFMATDPVTSPTTPFGTVLYGIFLGVLTVVFRYLTPFPEGVATAILTMNLFVVILDKIGVKARFHFKKYISILLILLVGVTSLGIYIGVKKELASKNDESNVDSDFKILSKEGSGNTQNYVVTQKGYIGLIKAEIHIVDGVVETITVLEENESFYEKVEKEQFLDRLIQKQNDLENVDTVSGATVTSTALKKMLLNTLSDFTQNGGVLKQEATEEPIPPSETTTPDPKPEEPEEPKEPEEPEELDFEILSKVEQNGQTIYHVAKKGFSENRFELQIIFMNGLIYSINTVKMEDTYYGVVQNNNYLFSLIYYQQYLDTLDTVAGATVTSTALKEAVIKTIEDYEAKNEE